MATRMVIPIPQPEEQSDLAFEFVDRPDGLMEFRVAIGDDEDSTEATRAHIAAFRKVGTGIDSGYWAQGAVVASLSKKYGQRGPELENLAEAVDRSASHLRHMALTYRTFTLDESCPWEQHLTFKHHMIACRHVNPSAALAVAKAGGMPCKTFEAWVSEQSLRRATKATKTARQAVRNSWREHLLHIDQVIVDDFIKMSPNQEYARRVCGEWRVEIADELKQLEFTENRELVINAIDERGAEDEKAIRQLTGIDRGEDSRILHCLVEENLYEWIPKGGKGDDQRGSPAMILHKVGEMDGGAYNDARPEHQYMN